MRENIDIFDRRRPCMLMLRPKLHFYAQFIPTGVGRRPHITKDKMNTAISIQFSVCKVIFSEVAGFVETAFRLR